MRTLAVALVAAIGGTSQAADLPANPCALLKAEEIQALAANASIGAGVADASMKPIGLSCTWKWGPRTPQWGETNVTVTVIDVSKAAAGRNPDAFGAGIGAKVKAAGPDGSPVTGVGDAAGFFFEPRSFNGTAEAYLKSKGVLVSVRFHSGEALASKDRIVALLKDAAGRI